MKGMAEFIIAKHRNGRVDTVLLRFIDTIIKFASSQGMHFSQNGTTFDSKMNQPSTSSAQEEDPLASDAPNTGFTI